MGREKGSGTIVRTKTPKGADRWRDENAALRSRIEELEEAAKRMPVAIINLGPDATPADEANLRVQFALAVVAERARIRAAVEELPHVDCDDLDCSHDDLSYPQHEHPWLDRAAVLAIIDGAALPQSLPEDPS